MSSLLKDRKLLTLGVVVGIVFLIEAFEWFDPSGRALNVFMGGVMAAGVVLLIRKPSLEGFCMTSATLLMGANVLMPTAAARRDYLIYPALVLLILANIITIWRGRKSSGDSQDRPA